MDGDDDYDDNDGEVRLMHSFAPGERWGERAGSPITSVEGWHIPRLSEPPAPRGTPVP